MNVGDRIIVNQSRVNGNTGEWMEIISEGVLTSVYTDWSGVQWVRYDYTRSDGVVIENEAPLACVSRL